MKNEYTRLFVYDYHKIDNNEEKIDKNHQDFVFFWRPDKEPNGYLSQWFLSDFTVDNIKYCCCEQYMMAEKAKLMKDFTTRDKILNTKNPKTMKSLGRKVKNWDESLWINNCMSIVYKGNLAKFSQNEDLKRELKSTKDSILVEASPYDKIWGIGYNYNDINARNPNKWKGYNQLGVILMQVRDSLNNNKIETPDYNQININIIDEKDNTITYNDDNQNDSFDFSKLKTKNKNLK